MHHLAARALGVDFGTSNSTVGWQRAGLAALLPLEGDKLTLPSVVFFNAEDDSTCFGRAALASYLEGNEGRLMRSLKSLLGSSLIEGQTEVAGRALPFKQLLQFFIRELKQRAEQSAQQPFDYAVFGRPVHFVDHDEAADHMAQKTLADIAHAVGFKEVVFQYEPIAAAYAYEATITREELVLVVDIGGGTSDFSLIRLSPAARARQDRTVDVLGNAGVHIGGTDFDRQLSLGSVMPLLGYRSRLSYAEMPSSYYFNLATWHTINQAYTRQVWSELIDVRRDALEPMRLARLMSLIEQRAGHWLALEVETAKIALSDTEAYTLRLDRVEAGLAHSLSRALFEQRIAELVDQIEGAVSTLLQLAGVGAEHVDTLFFTGGSGGVPILRQRLQARLPTVRAVQGDLFGSIGMGLAIDAARVFA